MVTIVDKLLIAGVVIGALLTIGCAVGAIFYDPDINLGHGKLMPRSLVRNLNYLWWIGPDGNAYEWHSNT
jgi:hypothetical protein